MGVPLLLSVRLLLIACLLHQLFAFPAHADLTRNFYKRTCPHVESIVRTVVKNAVAKETRMAASLLRLHFHDCFVQGCDASLLLKSIDGIQGEQEALPNKNSTRGFNVVDDMKAALENECQGVVSCADVLAIAARDSVLLSGGPFYRVLLGRRDGLSANRALANAALPSFLFNVSGLVDNFAAVGLSASDMVALSGAHSIGKAHCPAFAARLNGNQPDLASAYRTQLQQLCTPLQDNGDTLANLDVGTPTVFDNRHYANLQKGKGLLHSDEVLYSTPGSTRDQVVAYANDQSAFFRDFATAMIKMGSISPLTGTQGEIRRQCGVVNTAAAAA